MLEEPIVNFDTVVIGFPPACQNPSQQNLMCLLKTQTDGERVPSFRLSRLTLAIGNCFPAFTKTSFGAVPSSTVAAIPLLSHVISDEVEREKVTSWPSRQASPR